MGFALVDELQLLEHQGLTPAEALRAATVEPARAMRIPEAFGQIKKGMRADLVLLDADPLKGTAAYRSNHGVIAHGWWLDRGAIDRALDQLAAIYAEPDATFRADPASAERIRAQAQERISGGFAFDAMRLQALARALRAAKMAHAADPFEAMAILPVSGPCAEELPR